MEFEIQIAAPVATVWRKMFDPQGYTTWTAPFTEGSYFEGSWAEGERMRFLAPGGSGMVAEIAVNRRQEFLSIKHVGTVKDGVEDTDSEAVRSWAPAFENYRFAPVGGGTRVTVEQEVPESFEDAMREVWPKALSALKALCETQ